MDEPHKPEATPETDVDIVLLAAAYERAQKCGLTLEEYFQRVARCFKHRPDGVGWRSVVSGAYGHLSPEGDPFRDLPTLIQRYLIARFPEGAKVRVPEQWKYGHGYTPPELPLDEHGHIDESALSSEQRTRVSFYAQTGVDLMAGRQPGAIGPRDASFPETIEDRDRQLLAQARVMRENGESWKRVYAYLGQESGLSYPQLSKLLKPLRTKERAEKREADRELRRRYEESVENMHQNGETIGDIIRDLAAETGKSRSSIRRAVRRKRKEPRKE